MLSKRLLIPLAVLFLVGMVCVPPAHGLGYPWGSHGDHGMSYEDSGSEDTAPEEQTEGDMGAMPMAGGPVDGGPYDFGTPGDYPPDEPIGEPISSVPEPMTLVLLGSALAGLGSRQWRKRKHS